MFQTEPVLYLQAIGNAWFASLMSWVTSLGYSEFYIPLVIVVAFGINLRKGILLVHMLYWNGVLTDFAKNYFALPRPSDVDSAVKYIGSGVENPTPFHGRGARSFWSAIDQDVLAHFRSAPDVSWGFPSGHVSVTTTIWGGMFALFRSAPLRIVAVALILLMPISRMYLGRHFLADVLGGLVLGGTIVAAAYVLLLRGGRKAHWFELPLRFADRTVWFYVLIAYLILIPLVLLAIFPGFEADEAGRLFGVDLGFVALMLLGLPNDAASLARRIIRVVVGLAIFLIAGVGVNQGISAANLVETPLVDFIADALPPLISIFATIYGGTKIGLYSAAEQPG